VQLLVADLHTHTKSEKVVLDVAVLQCDIHHSCCHANASSWLSQYWSSMIS